MQRESDRRRLVAAAPAACAPMLHNLFAQPALQSWDMLPADSLAQARFLVQHSPCDAVLLSGNLLNGADDQGLRWLRQRSEQPIVFLAGNDADVLALAYRQGIDLCVPEHLIAGQPDLLAAALQRAVGLGKMQKQHRQLKRQLHESSRHVDRLVGLIWRTTPSESTFQWYPQRYALERLDEELERTKRHGTPLSLALGEVEAEGTNDNDVADWMATALSRVKRRSDVAGQYGPHGFMLVMVHTSKEGGMACCKRIRKLLEGSPKNPLATTVKPVRMYFGVTSTVDHQPTPQCLLRCAEENLRLARAGQADRIVAV